MQMTGDIKSRPSWRLSCHTFECQLWRLAFGRPCERSARSSCLLLYTPIVLE